MIERVLDWRNRRAWLNALPRYASQVLTPPIRQHIETTRPECWSDDFRWLPNQEEVLPAFSEKLWSYYTHAKAFHGCRPESLATYFEEGLRGQEPDRILQTFRRLYADVPTSALNKAIRLMGERRGDERGSIWLSTDDHQMIRDHGHYIISGSEYLLALAANIHVEDTWEDDYRLRLRDVGIPTILEVDIPVDLIPARERLAGARVILSHWGQRRARRLLGSSSSPGYRLSCNLPPSSIKAHYHPGRVKDFHTPFGLYINKQLKCDMCA
ncbi:hypothetical protein DM813_04275 [Pseudomonas alkylphenolica]|uniref:Uncharacterized protein n=1 Tax=Pseudomonas alkylphenolica TaxID=237609 RepID=A0A443ZW14_9PSED|nr:hypothetical protein [Pseudomonas alkylphenolica]RWU24965.1 hypothetical protein DM813_04275 [Pseudomonas alkylphenolica]